MKGVCQFLGFYHLAFVFLGMNILTLSPAAPLDLWILHFLIAPTCDVTDRKHNVMKGVFVDI